MRKTIWALLASAALVTTALLAPAPSVTASDDTISVPPGQTVTFYPNGTHSLGRTALTSVSTEYRAKACNVDIGWWSTDGAGRSLWRTMEGTVVLRVPWARETSGRDTSWVNWSYNPPGSGPGEGTGISVENQTNYTLENSFTEMINIVERKWYSGVDRIVPQDEKAHVLGISDEDNFVSWGDFNAHSYTDNAPRIAVTLNSANWGTGASAFSCTNYPSDIPA